jgi:hypothetical protein
MNFQINGNSVTIPRRIVRSLSGRPGSLVLAPTIVSSSLNILLPLEWVDEAIAIRDAIRAPFRVEGV